MPEFASAPEPLSVTELRSGLDTAFSVALEGAVLSTWRDETTAEMVVLPIYK